MHLFAGHRESQTTASRRPPLQVLVSSRAAARRMFGLVVIGPDAYFREGAVHRDVVELAAAGAQVVDLPLAAVHVLEALLLKARLEGARELLARVPLIHLRIPPAMLSRGLRAPSSERDTCRP